MKFVSHREFNRIKEIFENCGVPLLIEKHGSNREPISCVSWYFKSENESLYDKSRYFKYNSKYQLFGISEEGYGEDARKEYYVFEFGEYMLYIFGQAPVRERDSSAVPVKSKENKEMPTNGTRYDGINW